VMAALLDEDVRDAGLGLPTVLHQPRDRKAGSPPVARATYSFDACTIEVWCVSDFLEKSAANLQSSTAEKARVLAPFFADAHIDLLIAVGTAGVPSGSLHLNGTVILGTNIFMHDGHPSTDPNPLSGWRVGPFDTLIPSSLSKTAFASITSFDQLVVSGSLVKSPNNPATPMPIANRSFVALGTINVTNYLEYTVKDTATANAFAALKLPLTGASLETTHGLLRTLGPSDFMFVSGITDSLGSFDQDVTKGQNFAASFNAGVVISALIPRINYYLTGSTPLGES